MTDAGASKSGSAIWWAIGVATLLVIAGALVGAAYWQWYVPRQPSIADAILKRDRSDVARFGRSDPASLDTLTGDPRRFDPTTGFHDDYVLPLNLAIELDDAETVALLLRLGADPNVGTTGDALPLTAAAARSPTITRLLVDHGADVHASNLVSVAPIVSLILSDASVPYFGKGESRPPDEVAQTRTR